MATWDDPEWQKESFKIFTQLAYEDWVREWREAKTMATREEMGKALFDALAEEGFDNFYGVDWTRTTDAVYGDYRASLARAAEKFAAWLREQEKLESIVTEEKRRQLWEKFRAYEPGRSMLCPKGHVLTHPVDIEKRFCGTCREYLP